MRFKPSNLFQIMGLSALVLAGANLFYESREDKAVKRIESTQLALYGTALLASGYYYLKRRMPKSNDWSR